MIEAHSPPEGAVYRSLQPGLASAANCEQTGSSPSCLPPAPRGCEQGEACAPRARGLLGGTRM